MSRRNYNFCFPNSVPVCCVWVCVCACVNDFFRILTPKSKWNLKYEWKFEKKKHRNQISTTTTKNFSFYILDVHSDQFCVVLVCESASSRCSCVVFVNVYVRVCCFFYSLSLTICYVFFRDDTNPGKQWTVWWKLSIFFNYIFFSIDFFFVTYCS